MLSKFRAVNPLWLAVTLLTSSAAAQVDRSALTGTVLDPAGRSLPSVRLIATDLATGLRREGISSGSGTFDLPELPVGHYTLRFEHEGFAPLVYPDLLQVVGQTRTLTVRMKIAVGPEEVRVTDEAPEINQTNDALGAREELAQVRLLPLNGRNWSTLTALVPGAVDAGGSNQRTIRFAGRGLDDNNFTYDGVDATNIVNQAQQPFVRLAIPTDSIEEFRVNTALFSAEQGSTPGGQIAVVSRSGGNQVHGDVFDYFRNDKLDAREPIDNVNRSKPPLRLNQYGGSISGPIQRDRTFFFLAYEGYRQSFGQTLQGIVPTAAFRAQAVAANPALANVLAAYPLPTAVSNGSFNFVSEGKQIVHEDSGTLRLDHKFTEKDTADFRFNFDAALQTVPLAGSGQFLLDRQSTASRPVNGVLEELHIFSNAWVNEAKFGVNRGNVYTTNRPQLNTPYSIAYSGLTTLNNNSFKTGVGNSFSYLDNLTWVHGQHTLKMGVEVRRIQLNQGNTATGSVTFAPNGGLLNNSVSSASYAAALPINGLRKTHVYSFIQDEFKVHPNLTLNLGLRYSFFNVFHEVNGKAIPFDFATCGPQGYCPRGASFGQPNLLDVDPRVAIAWSPAGSAGKTTVRAGFGLYHGDGQQDDQNLPFANEVPRYSLSLKTIPGLSFPIDPFLATTPGIATPRDMDRLRKDEYVTQYGLSVQQELGQGWSGTLSYVGSKGTYLLRTSYTNLIDPATGTRQYAGFGQVETRGNENGSSYNALVATVRKSFTRGLLFQANYAYSHELDQDAAGGGDSDFPQNPNCFSCEWASGDYDVRHVFTGNVVYELPYGRGKSFGGSGGVLPMLFGNWQTSSIVTTRTGLPVNVTIDRSSSSVATGYVTNQRPDRVPGVSLTPAAGSGVRNWINPAAFRAPAGLYGNAGRNLVRGPGLWQADMSLVRNIVLRESASLQFRAEFFNIFNRAQYGSPAADFSTSTFGQITAPVNTAPIGTGTPRETQLALRLNF